MAPSTGNALSADSILEYMVKSIPTPPSDSPQQRLIKDPFAAVALFAHACMLAVGFRLIGLGEDHKIDTPADSQDVQPLPAEWDASSSYAFRYAHPQSSMEFLVKVNRLGSKALIFGVGLGDDKTASFEIKAEDYISEGSLKEATISSDRTPAIRNAFISNGRIDDLASLFKLNIIQKLVPGIQKAGYEEAQSAAEARDRSQGARPPEHDPLRDDHQPPARPYPFDDPLAAEPRRPFPAGDFPPPGFEDEYELNRPRQGLAPNRPGFGPVPIGERDLYPPGLGPHDPLRIGPGGGFRGGGGGMHPTFDDLTGRAGAEPYDPSVPPGARYDPIGPGYGPPNLRGPGARFPGGRGGGFGGNPFGGFGSGDFI